MLMQSFNFLNTNFLSPTWPSYISNVNAGTPYIDAIVSIMPLRLVVRNSSDTLNSVLIRYRSPVEIRDHVSFVALGDALPVIIVTLKPFIFIYMR
jgi:hypothetical protein